MRDEGTFVPSFCCFQAGKQWRIDEKGFLHYNSFICTAHLPLVFAQKRRNPRETNQDPRHAAGTGADADGCAAGQKTFQRGSVEGRTYTSEFLGLTCTAPEEFAYLSDQEIAEMNSITLESGEDLASAMKQRLEDGGQVQDMYLMTEDALHRVGITVDKVTDGKTAVDMAAFIENGIARRRSTTPPSRA